ncbi:ent-kaurenoic acid monooxygenase [Trifolium repens]|nr:ent-kaurenoic acid monooxygenase [Trifolium repens]
MGKVSFKFVIQIFLGSCDQSTVIEIGDLFHVMSSALFSLMPINVPGFLFNKALKARKKFTKIVQSIIDERRMTTKNGQIGEKNDLLNILLEINDEEGEKLEDKDIIDLLISLLFGGHDSTAAGMMWTIMHLTQHPHCMKKAKEEQEEIMKARPPSQKRLSNEEIKKMVYLSQVFDETLRHTSVFSLFREATTDVNINGYFIPKGWKVLVWLSAMHMTPEHHSNPEEYNPSRWDGYNPATGTFLPFGIGRRLCPGRDLSRYEMTIFLHYFVLNYKLERINPECPLTSLPYLMPVDNCLAKVIKLSDS